MAKKRRLRLGLFILPMIFLVAFMALGEKILGPEKFAAWENSPWLGVVIAAVVILIIVGTVGPFLKPMLSFFGGGDAKRILATGRPAKAKVLAVGENSEGGVVTINDQPYLNLKLEFNDGARVWQGNIDIVVPRWAVPQVQPGAELNIVLDPQKPGKMAIDWNKAFGDAAPAPVPAPSFGATPAPAAAPRRRMNIFPLVFLSAVPIIIWALMEEWGPYVLGAEETRRIMDGGVFVGVAVALSLLPVAASLAFFAKPMLSFFGGGAEKRIRATGRAGRATLLGIGENSGGGVVTINDQPYLNLVLRVDDGTRAPYDVSIDAVIPRAMVPQFQPGAVIPVKIDQQDPNKVVIDWA